MKKLLLILTLSFVFVLMFTAVTYAMDFKEVQGISVYASEAEQNAIYETIQKSNQFMYVLNSEGISIDKESITPVYTADFLEYAKTGIFTIKPYVIRHFNAEYTETGNQIYMAKTITSDGAFSGHIRFYVENNIAKWISMSIAAHGGSDISVSYADHMKRIEKLMGITIPASTVRYVSGSYIGDAFYINDGKVEALVLIEGDGSIYYNDESKEMEWIVYFGDGLKKKADEKLIEVTEWSAYMEKWRAQHPDENPPTGDGNGIGFYSASKEDLDDIRNIREFLSSKANSNIEISNPATGQSGDNQRFLLYITVLSVFGIIAIASVVLVKCNKTAIE